MKIALKSHTRTEIIDITASVQKIVAVADITKGLCVVYCPHTTADITINENADPDVQMDMENFFTDMVPWENNYRHLVGNTAAHIKTTLIGFSQTIPIEAGQLALGTWQGIYFCEFDGPRSRNVQITILPVERKNKWPLWTKKTVLC